jgi:hypothetical protein
MTAYSNNDSRLTNSLLIAEEVVPMFRLRQSSVLIFTALLASAAGAQDKPAAPWVVDRSLTVSAQGAPVPALKYRLLPLSAELKEGNAVPIYLRLTHEQSDAARKYWTETPKPWNELPVDQVPLDEARKFLQGRRNFLRQFELGARRRTAEWNYTLDEDDPIGILLPDAQWMRNYAPMLVLQVRVALAEGNFTAAAHHLATGLAFSRHVGEGPFLINSLVAIALVSQFAGTVADFMERPEAPNLYWALAALPHPLIDLQRQIDFEYRLLGMEFPELDDLDRERSAEQWDGVLRRIRTGVWAFAKSSGEGGKSPSFPPWFPKHYAPDDPAAKSPDLPAARQFVARNRGLSAQQVEALPAAQVLLQYLVHTYQVDRDELYRAFYLPYPQARPLFDSAKKRLKVAPTSEGQVLSHLLLPGLDRVVSAQARVERSLAALRVIEALRMYASAHDGRLPDKLSDVTEVPLPDDPGTGRPFEYSRDGDTGTLVSQIPGDPPSNSGVRYRVTIRKK